MTTAMRFGLWMVSMFVLGALWRAGALGIATALAGWACVGAGLLAMPARAGRRRRSSLRYVEMGKQPMGLL